MRLEEWLHTWMKVYKEPYLSEGSIKRLKVTLRNHISPRLLGTELIHISVFDVDKALSECRLGRSRKYAYHVLYSSLKKAYCLGMIEKDIAEGVEQVRHRQKRGKALSHDEQYRFLRDIAGTAYEYVFRFMLMTGFRRGETVSLRWNDIDVENGVIHVRGTKTNSSDRVFFLSPELLAVLYRQRSSVNDHDFVFPYPADRLTHAFKHFCPGHKLHDLRHTFVTRCAESGLNISVTQQLAGHSSIQTTLNIYTHVLTDFAREEFRKFRLDKDKTEG